VLPWIYPSLTPLCRWTPAGSLTRRKSHFLPVHHELPGTDVLKLDGVLDSVDNDQHSTFGVHPSQLAVQYVLPTDCRRQL
jgi:hypothetical protein